jgi:hypothetical protein
MRTVRWATALATLTACSFEHRLPAAASGDAPRVDDTPMIDVPLGTWSPPVEIAELNSGTGDDDPSLTADLLEIYWGSRRTNGNAEDIWTARRTTLTSPWEMLHGVDTLNTMFTETTMKITSDGMAIFFTRYGGTDYDVFAGKRTAPDATTWESVARVDALSSTSDDYGPAVRADLLRVLLCRGTTVSDEALYVATRGAGVDPWPAPTPIAELDEPSVSECDPMEPRDNVLYFASNRTADGKYDIYRTERAPNSDAWGPIAAVPEVNTSGFNDRDPWVSADERFMVFSSDRSGGITRLFVTTR